MNSVRTAPEKVWVASAWFTDSDPFLRVAFDPSQYTKKQAEDTFKKIWEDEVRELWEGADWGEDITEEEFFEDADHWTGIMMEDIRVLGLTEEEKQELIDNGYVMLPT